MSANERGKALCAVAGCMNTVEWNSDFCVVCNAERKNKIRRTCLAPGCSNTADFNDNLLCMVCFHSLKLASKNEKIRKESIGYEEKACVLKPCETDGCTNNAIFMNKCDPCIEEILDNAILKENASRNAIKENAVSSINTNRTSKILATNELETDTTCDTILTMPDNGTSVAGAFAYGHVDLATDRRKRNMLCTTPGCTRPVEDDGRYCRFHTEKKVDKAVCAVKGCGNPTESVDDFLCMLCAHQGRASEVFGTSRDVQQVGTSTCIVRGCTNVTESADNWLCVVCSQDPMCATEEFDSRDDTEIFESTRRAQMDGRSTCIVKGCSNTAERADNWLCMVCAQAQKRAAEVFDSRRGTPNVATSVCIMSGCGNSTEGPDDFLCIFCSREQKRAIEEFESKRSTHLSRPGCPNVTPKVNPLAMLTNHGSVSSSASGHSGNATIDLKSLAMALPRIPLPTGPSSIQNLNKENEHDGIEVLARGFSDNESVTHNTVSNIPIALCDLPPIPMPFDRSSSLPGTSIPPSLIIQQFNTDLITSRTPSLPNSLRLDSLCRSVSVEGAVSSILPSNELNSTNTSKQICKTEGCKFFVNEGLGGYCSECFMCCNISENVPPSRPPHDLIELDEYIEREMAGRFENQICKGGDCEFFGNADFDGYCSRCYKEKPINNTAQIALPTDNDDKLCIICLQNVYNTVLLPCGHLYLCYECANTIKSKGKTCPACRSHIRSFHRVYTPD